jgi:RNA-binding protein 8A
LLFGSLPDFLKKGYALVEYATKEEAEAAIKEADNSEFLGNNIHVDWAFVKGSNKTVARYVI